jgi:hypothetical protein
MCIIYFRSRYISTQSKKMKSKTSHILYCTLYKHDSYRYHQCVQIKLRNKLLRFQDRFNVLMVCCHWYLTSNENLLRFISICLKILNVWSWFWIFFANESIFVVALHTSTPFWQKHKLFGHGTKTEMML